MEKDLTNKLVNILYKHFNFRIIEFSIDARNKIWGCSLKNELILFHKIDSFNNYRISKTDIKNNGFNEEDTKLVDIIIINNSNTYMLNSLHTTSNYIIINEDKLNIEYAGGSIENEINLFGNILKAIEESNSKKEEKGSFKITYIIIAVNIIMYVITVLLSNRFLNFDTDILVSLGAKYNPAIYEGQYYRFITCMFLHGGLMHIVLNMYSLYSIGPFIEDVYGKFKFIIIYFISGIFASMSSFYFSNDVSVGASGAIFGLLGAALFFAYKMKSKIGKEFLKNVTSVIVANIVIGFTVPNIDMFAHVGGLLAGFLTSAVVKYSNYT